MNRKKVKISALDEKSTGTTNPGAKLFLEVPFEKKEQLKTFGKMSKPNIFRQT